MKRGICFLLSVFFVLSFFTAFPLNASSLNENKSQQMNSLSGDESVVYYLDSLNNRIELQSVEDQLYLFLPAYADFSFLPLFGNMDLYGSVADVSENADGNVNLQNLFDEPLQSGATYQLKAVCGDAELNFCVIKDCSLSTIHIVSSKSIEEINADKSITGKGSFSMISADGTVITAPSDSENNLSKFKGRGNTSWDNSGEKKPYAVTLASKVELISGAGKATKWNLISDNCQSSFVHEAAGLANIVAYDLYQSIGGAYALSYEPVNLYVNGEYRGVYLLTEKVELNKQRVNISSFDNDEDEDSQAVVISSNGLSVYPPKWDLVDFSNSELIAPEDDVAINSGIQAYAYSPRTTGVADNGGYLIELDARFYGENSWFVTRRGYAYVLKEPEFATKEQVQQIAAYFQEYEDALFSDTGLNGFGKYYTDYIDLDSIVKRCLVDLASGQIDTFNSSCYFAVECIDSDFSKIVAGPVWDYDGSNYSTKFLEGIAYARAGSVNSGGRKLANTQYMMLRLLQHGDFSERLYSFAVTTFSERFGALANEALSEYIRDMSAAQEMNSLLWNSNGLNSRSSDFSGFYTCFCSRYQMWMETWTQPSYLRGIYVIDINGELRAEQSADSQGLTYQWYRVDAEHPESGIALSGETSASFRPAYSGTYYVVASGTALPGTYVSKMTSAPMKFCVEHMPSPAVRENERPATCADCGTYDSVIYCSFCNAEIARETVLLPKTDSHDFVWDGNMGSGGKHGLVCSACGATAETECDIDHGTCTVCGWSQPIPDNGLRFYKTCLDLQSFIGVQLIVKTSVINAYDRVYVDIARGNEDPVSYDDLTYVEGSTAYKFTELAVAPKNITTEYTATLYAEKDGQLYIGETRTLSVRSLAEASMASCYSKIQANNSVAKNAANLRVLADLLYYGEAAQIQLNTNLDNLATTGIAPEYLAYATQTNPEISSAATQVISTGATTVTMSRCAVSVSASVTVTPIIMLPENVMNNDLEVIVTYNGTEKVISGIELIPYSERFFYCDFSALAAREMKNTFTVTVYDAGTHNPVSPTYQYSIESLASEKLGDTEALANLMYCMINYGDSAQFFLSRAYENE